MTLDENAKDQAEGVQDEDSGVCRYATITLPNPSTMLADAGPASRDIPPSDCSGRVTDARHRTDEQFTVVLDSDTLPLKYVPRLLRTRGSLTTRRP